MEKQHYNVSEQLDYLAYMLNVRTKGKAYENFIVNAIYTKVGNSELVPVTQQYVRSSKDPRKYYLLDLYFPQLNYGIEVDEAHHLDVNQKDRDSIREEDVKSAIECEEDRIPIFDSNGKKRSYEDICSDIDRVVSTLQNKILEKGPLKWETNEDRKKATIAKGRFHVNDDVNYGSITEIYNICGGIRTGSEKGREAKKLQKCFYKLNEKYKLWVPILAIKDADGFVTNSKMGFENTLSEDRTILTEKANHIIYPLTDINYKRVIFMRMKDRFGKNCIKFIGVFELTEDSYDKENVHIYRRVSKEVKFSDLN